MSDMSKVLSFFWEISLNIWSQFCGSMITVLWKQINFPQFHFPQGASRASISVTIASPLVYMPDHTLQWWKKPCFCCQANSRWASACHGPLRLRCLGRYLLEILLWSHLKVHIYWMVMWAQNWGKAKHCQHIFYLHILCSVFFKQ